MADEKISRIGGIGIGLFKSSRMPASLNIDKNVLEISVLFGGRYSFLPKQVISIEKYGIIPFLGWGIRIHHNITAYPDKIIFWCFGDPLYLIQQIRDIGFLPTGNQSTLPTKRTNPIRWYSIAALILIWNFLFFLGIGIPPKWTEPVGWISFFSVFFFFLGSIGVRRFQWLQKLLLKPNRTLNEITVWLNFITVVLGFLSGILVLFLLTNPFRR